MDNEQAHSWFTSMKLSETAFPKLRVSIHLDYLFWFPVAVFDPVKSTLYVSRALSN